MISFFDRRQYQQISTGMKDSGGGCFTVIRDLHLRRSDPGEDRCSMSKEGVLINVEINQRQLAREQFIAAMVEGRTFREVSAGSSPPVKSHNMWVLCEEDFSRKASDTLFNLLSLFPQMEHIKRIGT